jgi:hypothetical protein
MQLTNHMDICMQGGVIPTAPVGQSFLNAVNQEQGNTIVNYYGSSSSEALSPHGYNDHQTKVTKDMP